MIKASKMTLADGVEDRLLDYMRINHLKSGELLPKEIELAESLQISRHIIREGISRLKALGIVEAKKRRGTVLCRPEPFAGFQKLAEAQLFTESDCRHFMELRIAMELGMCTFIYARRTREKLKEPREVAGMTNSSVRQIAHEVDFHSKLMAFAENPAASDFRNVIMTAFGSIRKRTKNAVRTISHREICDALEFGTAAEFQEAIQRHFEPYLSNMTYTESQLKSGESDHE